MGIAYITKYIVQHIVEKFTQYKIIDIRNKIFKKMQIMSHYKFKDLKKV